MLASENSLSVNNVRVDTAWSISDHHLVTASVATAATTAKPPTVYKYREIRSVDPAEFERRLRRSVLFTSPERSTDAFETQLRSVVTQLLDEMAPLRTSRKRKSKPITRWLSRDAITAKRTRRKLERRWARSKLESDRLAFRNACRYANKLIVQSRASYFRQQLTSAPNCKRRWQIAKELLHVAPVNCVGFGSVTISCQSFADFFKSKIDNLKRTVASLAKMSSPPTFDDPSFNGTPLDVLATLDPSTVLKIITQMKPKSSAVDYIPTSLIKSCSTVFSELICNLANLSFAEGIFPNSFKLADVTPRLKKIGLDTAVPANYRPISNLNNISKILERLFLSVLQPHILSCPAFNQLQSAYRPRHSTETALLHTLDHIYSSADRSMPTALVSLDLSAAFDTIDHSILISRLHSSFGISGPALAWLSSYLFNRSQVVKIGNSSSTTSLLTTGVPQGSVLGPVLFTAYVSPIGHIASAHNLLHQQYADDTQLFVSLSSASASDITKLEQGLQHLNNWLCYNGLCLNPDKSEVIIFGTSKKLQSSLHPTTVNIAGCPVTLSDKISTLGVTLDQCLTLDTHVSSICKSSFYHIRALRHCRSSLPVDVRITLATTFVQSRLDYANSILFNTSQRNLTKLQRVQNHAAKAILPSYPPIPSAEMVHNLHWLPIKQRINFKIALLTYGILNSHQPSYLSHLLTYRPVTRVTRNSDQQLLLEKRSATAFGSRAFSVAAPRIWNSIPLNIRTAASVDLFRRNLKTHYFSC